MRRYTFLPRVLCLCVSWEATMRFFEAWLFLCCLSVSFFRTQTGCNYAFSGIWGFFALSPKPLPFCHVAISHTSMPNSNAWIFSSPSSSRKPLGFTACLPQGFTNKILLVLPFEQFLYSLSEPQNPERGPPISSITCDSLHGAPPQISSHKSRG